MLGHGFLDYGQAEAGPALVDVAGGVGAVEGLADHWQVVGGDPYPGVGDEEIDVRASGG